MKTGDFKQFHYFKHKADVEHQKKWTEVGKKKKQPWSIYLSHTSFQKCNMIHIFYIFNPQFISIYCHKKYGGGWWIRKMSVNENARFGRNFINFYHTSSVFVSCVSWDAMKLWRLRDWCFIYLFFLCCTCFLKFVP